MDPRVHPDRFWPRLAAALDAVPAEDSQPPPNARVGAVLVLVEDTPAGPSVVLTRRRRDLRSHPGQISFPGGRLDEDESIEEAALREADEEVGLDPATVEVLGRGPRFYIPPSRFWVVPVVARWRDPHALDPNPWEVDEVLRVPIATLLEPDRWRAVPLSDRGSSWAWDLDEDLLWGATAIVVALVLGVAVDEWSEGLFPDDLSEERIVRPWEDAPPWQRTARLGEDLPEVEQVDVPHVTAAQMRRVDELLAELGLGVGTLAEQAGRGVAHALRRLAGGDLAAHRVTVLAGTGRNGAGGLAAARLLDAAGVEVEVVLLGPPRLAGQVRTLEAAGLDVRRLGDGVPDDLTPGDLVVDAMIGYGAEPPLRDLPLGLTEWLRRHAVPIVALDLPTGVGADSGLQGPCVGADVTVALAAPKVGLRPAIVRPYVGDLYLADIGVPREVWRRAGAGVPDVFSRGPLVRLRPEDPGSDAGTPDQAAM